MAFLKKEGKIPSFFLLFSVILTMLVIQKQREQVANLLPQKDTHLNLNLNLNPVFPYFSLYFSLYFSGTILVYI